MKKKNYKTTKYLLLLIAILILSSFFDSLNQETVDVDKIMNKVQETILGHADYKVEEEMILTRKNGKSYTRNMISFNKEVDEKEDYSLIIFNTPKDVKGTKSLIHSYLSKVDNQWIYFPSINATKKIANENKSGSFMGSEFANEDLGIMNLFKYRFEFLETKMHKKEECYVMRSYPVNKYSGYKYIDLFVSKETYLPIFYKMYDRREVHFKNEAVEWRKFNDEFWLIEKVVIENIKKNRTTTLNRFNFDFDVNYDISFFNSENIANVD